MLRADFAEPFVPTVKGASDEYLAAALASYRADTRSKSQKVDLLESYLERYPEDPWAASVRVNLGLYYRQTGRFTRALACLADAWEVLRPLEAPHLKALADRAVGEYALTLAHLGRYEDLEPLLTGLNGRSLEGTATELIASAREGLLGMSTTPQTSFLCGPAALRRVGERTAGWDSQARKVVASLPSSRKGTSLQQVQELSERAGLEYQMAFRQPGAPVLAPCVVHWRVGHFAALLEPQDGVFPVGDDTAGYGREETKIELAALEEESSGYFLVPAGPLPPGWRSVSSSEGSTVWGRGFTGLNKDVDATGADDVVVPEEQPADCGMTTWSAHAMLVSLRLKDTPVGLSPAAFAVPFQVTYSQREAGLPSVFDFSNLGPKWTSNWTSFVTDERAVNDKARVFKPGGGTDEYVFESGGSVSETGRFSQAVLSFTGEGFLLQWPDGSQDEYFELVGSRYHLTCRTSAQGNRTVLAYDNLGRLTSIVDAAGRVMTLSYDLSSDPLKITGVTDPFGRSASFTYTPDGHLASVTDTLGLVSSYQYGANDFINRLTTPYGVTRFSYGDINTSPFFMNRRTLHIIDAGGRAHRVDHANFGAPTEPSAPEGMPLLNNLLQFRNTFYWGPNQLDSPAPDAIPDPAKATVYHFLHKEADASGALSQGRVLESVKKPLQNRVWYFYEGQDPVVPGPVFQSGNDNVTHVGRVMTDGRTQLTKYQYNWLGNVTQMTDPLGRVFDYTYAGNGIDLTGVVTGGRTLMSAAYDDNHNITSLTDASGQTSSFSYNARGQLLSSLDPLGELTSYSYTTTGNLATIHGPLGKTTTFNYDSAERVSSATDSEGYSIQVNYDSADRPVSLTYPDGTSDSLTYDRLDLVSTRDRLGGQTQMTHDALRRLTSITDANGGVTGLTYGLEDKPRTLTDPRGSATNFQYDLQQRLISKQYPGGAAQTVTYENCLGRVKRVTDALGQSKTFSYFLDNQVESIVYSDGTPAVYFSNDSFLPRPLSMTDGQGTTTIAYVPVGSPGGNRMASITGPFGDQAFFAYDAAGRQVSRTVNGLAETVAYDQLWRPTSMTNALDTFEMSYLGKTGKVTWVGSGKGPESLYSYAANVGDRRLTQIKNLRTPGQIHNQFDYSHDAEGQITQWVQTLSNTPPGQVAECPESCCHDGCCDEPCCRTACCQGNGACGQGHCKRGLGHGHGPDDLNHEQRHLAWVFQQVISSVWGWDSNVIEGQGKGNGNGNGNGNAGATTEILNFSYDNLSQLVGVSLNQTPVASYQFDPAGNLTGLTLGTSTTNFTYNSLNQPTSPGSNVFDAKGQTTEQEGRVFEWDAQGRVTAIVVGDQRTELSYDGLSRRTAITEIVDDEVVSKKLYWWLGGSIVCERDGLQPGFPITKRYFGQGVMQGSQKLYYTFDHLGSVRQLLDDKGKVAADYRYSIYGVRTRVAGNCDSDFGYAGLFHHKPTGLDLATYRVYDAKLQRFISRDPLGEGVDYNLYRYAGNNPIIRTDPRGLNPSHPAQSTTTAYPQGEIPFASAAPGHIEIVTPFGNGDRLNVEIMMRLTVPPVVPGGDPAGAVFYTDGTGWDNHPQEVNGSFWYAKTPDPVVFVSPSGEKFFFTELVILEPANPITIDADFHLQVQNGPYTGGTVINITGTYRLNENGEFQLVPCP